MLEHTRSISTGEPTETTPMGERKLLCAVLEVAASDVFAVEPRTVALGRLAQGWVRAGRSPADLPKPQKAAIKVVRTAAKAMAWVISDQPAEPGCPHFTFNALCEYLDLEPEPTRARLLLHLKEVGCPQEGF